MCIIHSDAGLTGEQWPLPHPPFRHVFGPSGPRAYLPLSGRIASAFFPFLSFLRVVLLAGFRLVWFVVAWPFRSSYVLWGDKHLGIAGTFSPLPAVCRPTSSREVSRGLADRRRPAPTLHPPQGPGRSMCFIP
jgi:hypothetical protein